MIATVDFRHRYPEKRLSLSSSGRGSATSLVVAESYRPLSIDEHGPDRGFWCAAEDQALPTFEPSFHSPSESRQKIRPFSWLIEPPEKTPQEPEARESPWPRLPVAKGISGSQPGAGCPESLVPSRWKLLQILVGAAPERPQRRVQRSRRVALGEDEDVVGPQSRGGGGRGSCPARRGFPRCGRRDFKVHLKKARLASCG